MAKEDVQVIYEDHEDEYWMKPLREAIVNVGNSWAGGIVRRQQYNVDFTQKAMDRAHQTYLTQLGIQSREKMDKKKLTETRRNNDRIAKQQRITNEISNKRLGMAEKLFNKQMDDYEKVLGGTDAALQILDWDSVFQVVGDEKGGFKATVPEMEGRDKLIKAVRQSPTVADTYWSQIQNSKKYAKKLSGRVDFLLRLKKRRKNDPIIAGMVKTLEKEPDWADIQQDKDLRKAISNTMMDDKLWETFLKDNGLGNVSNNQWLDKKHHTDNFLDASQMYKNMGITDWEFNPLDKNQAADSRNYEVNVKAFTNVYAKGEIDQLLQGISLQGGNEAFRSNVEHLAAKGVQYIHANKMLFKSPHVTVASIKKNVGIVARGLEQRGAKKFKPQGHLQKMLYDYFTNPNAEIQNQQSEAIFNYLAGATESVGKGKPKASPTAYSLLSPKELNDQQKKLQLTTQANEPISVNSSDQQSVPLTPKLQGTLTDDTGTQITSARFLKDSQDPGRSTGIMGMNKNLARNLVNGLNDPPKNMKAWVETLKKDFNIDNWATTDPVVLSHALATAIDKNNGVSFLNQKKEWLMKNKSFLESLDDNYLFSAFDTATLGTAGNLIKAGADIAEYIGVYDDETKRVAAQVEAVQQFIRSNALTHIKQDPLFVNLDGSFNDSWRASLINLESMTPKNTKMTWKTIQQMKDTPSLAYQYKQFERILEYMNITKEPRPLEGDVRENRWSLDQELIKLAISFDSFQPLYKVNPDAVAQANE